MLEAFQDTVRSVLRAEVEKRPPRTFSWLEIKMRHFDNKELRYAGWAELFRLDTINQESQSFSESRTRGSYNIDLA